MLMGITIWRIKIWRFLQGPPLSATGSQLHSQVLRLNLQSNFNGNFHSGSGYKCSWTSWSRIRQGCNWELMLISLTTWRIIIWGPEDSCKGPLIHYWITTSRSRVETESTIEDVKCKMSCWRDVDQRSRECAVTISRGVWNHTTWITEEWMTYPMGS